MVFTVAADFKGHLENVTIFEATSSVATASTYLRGHRKFPSGVKTSENSSASQFFAMGVNDKNCQVSLLPSEPVCRLGVSQAKRYDTSSHLRMQPCESVDRNYPSSITTLSSPLPLSSGPRGFQKLRRRNHFETRGGGTPSFS